MSEHIGTPRTGAVGRRGFLAGAAAVAAAAATPAQEQALGIPALAAALAADRTA
ncbi:hypothetical protein ACIGFK_02150 [Streptomyces sp. NPDC085524]|uniref:hypothetical protein n=1 Tax=unclassified Streptomyces TaxID=2593676 RepID=UPI0035E2F9AB